MNPAQLGSRGKERNLESEVAHAAVKCSIIPELPRPIDTFPWPQFESTPTTLTPAIPKGFCHKAQGCAVRFFGATLGHPPTINPPNPERVAPPPLILLENIP